MCARRVLEDNSKSSAQEGLHKAFSKLYFLCENQPSPDFFGPCTCRVYSPGLCAEKAHVHLQYIYTYKRAVCVCWFVGLLFIGHTTFVHFAALPPSGREQDQPSSRAAPRARASACMYVHSESTRAHAVQLLNEKITTLMHFKNKTVRARMLSYTWHGCRDFSKRKTTCHFPSSDFSLPSLGVFTFRIVLNRILHKSSLLAPMESRRTRRPTFTAEERLERRREQDRRRHAERRARERREQTQVRRDVDRLPSSQARA